MTRPILISSGTGANTTVLPIKTVLPVVKNIPATVAQAKGYFQILAGPESGSGAPTALGEVVFAVDNASTATPVQVSININIGVDSSIKVDVTNQAGDVSLASLVIPKP